MYPRWTDELARLPHEAGTSDNCNRRPWITGIHPKIRSLSAAVLTSELGMPVRRLSTLLVACSFAGILSGCAKAPHLHGQVTVRLMADRDFAQILLAHCESGLELLAAIASLNIDKDIASTTDVMRRNEEGDRAAILSWIANQSAQPTAVGRIGEADIKSSHAKVIEQLRSRNAADLNEHVLRLLVSHRNEESAEIGKTPVKDKQLRRIVDSIQRRLAVELKELTRRLPATGV